MIKLSSKWMRKIISQPETGMGYYIVSIALNDGRKFDQVIIDEGYLTRVRGFKEIPFEEKDIQEIIVTHDQWDFRKEEI